MKLLFNAFLLFIVVQLQAQYDGVRIILGTEGVADAAYYEYDPPFKAKMIYVNQGEAVNLYPEQLMSSIVSADNQQWIDYNTLGGEANSRKKRPRYFEFVSSATTDSLQYQELISKMEFVANGEQMAVIKFYLHREDKDKPVGGVTVMSKEEGSWKVTSTTFTTDMAMCMLFFKPEVLKRFLDGTPLAGKEQEVYNNAATESGLNFNKLWVEQQKLTEAEYYELCDELNW